MKRFSGQLDDKIFAVQHFLDLRDHSADVLCGLIREARRLKAARRGLTNGAVDPRPLLEGCSLAMIFEKPSTRTRVSFEAAVRQAGGSALLLQDSQMGRGESAGDTARVLARLVDMVMVRANSHETILELAAVNALPVINALTDRSHPCQVMADMMTFEEHKGAVRGQRIAWVGDGNNMVTSLIEAAALLEFELVIASPQAYQPKSEVLDWAQQKGASVRLVSDPRDAVVGASAVMADTWVSMGDTDREARLEAFALYRVTEELMDRAKGTDGSQAIFMHCLPAHRGEEVTDAVMEAPYSVVFDTAENRGHMQKAIMAWLMGRLSF